NLTPIDTALERTPPPKPQSSKAAYGIAFRLKEFHRTMGTVTPISSVFPAEEAQKASRRVQDTIAERQQQLDQLKGFIDDNVSLINLVQKLPDETHHNIMVPFGKAAFFP
ncbi:UNVERIFIED_CONTAM: hypothetical protein Slati_2152600, partial [Sesamum latifolium]